MHLVVSCYPVLVDRNVLGVQELATRTVLPWSDVGQRGGKTGGGGRQEEEKDKPKKISKSSGCRKTMKAMSVEDGHQVDALRCCRHP